MSQGIFCYNSTASFSLIEAGMRDEAGIPRGGSSDFVCGKIKASSLTRDAHNGNARLLRQP
jgi:hypothetical protein